METVEQLVLVEAVDGNVERRGVGLSFAFRHGRASLPVRLDHGLNLPLHRLPALVRWLMLPVRGIVDHYTYQVLLVR